MSSPVILVGIDLGTTVCKALVFDDGLRLLGSATRDLSIQTLSATEIEQDAEEWWRVTAQVVREALSRAKASPRQVRGLGISAQGIAFVPADSAGQPLRSAFSWLDTRAAAQRGQILSRLSEWEIFSITGKRCSESYVLPKLLWFRQHEPRLYAACHRLLMPMDFLLNRLTGEWLTDHSMASGTMMYDVPGRRWSQALLETFDLDAAMLPELRWGGTPAGSLRPEAAEALGVGGEAVVAVGGQDQKVAALGAGIDLERTTVSLGTAMAITQKSHRPLIDLQMRVPCFTDLLPGNWVTEGSSICCSILDWARQTLLPERSYAEMDRLAEAEEGRGEPLFLYPFFSGAAAPHFRPEARGFLYGLNLATTPGQIVRSILEGIAFQIRENLEVLREVSRPATELRAFGGGAKSELWSQIIADISALPVSALGTSEAAATGAAILAGLGCGLYGRAEEAFVHLRVRRTFEPRPQAVSRYEELFQRYREIQKRVLKGA